MKKQVLLLFMSVLAYGSSLAQVGINTISPAATMDVKVKTTGTATTVAEGLIAPRLSRADLIAKDGAYSSTQTGTLIYVLDLTGTLTTKTVNVTSQGYYYFDGTVWQRVINNLPSSANIYSTDGTIQTNRTVTMADKTLAFTAATPSVNQFSVDGSTLSVDTQNDRVGIGTTSPTTKVDINGNLRIGTATGSNGSTNVSTLVRDNSTGEVKVSRSSTGNLSPINYVVYTLSNVNGDYIANFNTMVPTSDYTMAVIGSGFSLNLFVSEATTSSPSYAPASVFCYNENGTWHFFADYRGTSPPGGANGTWTIYCLIINNTLVKTLSPISQNLNGSSGGSAAAAPAGL